MAQRHGGLLTAVILGVFGILASAVAGPAVAGTDEDFSAVSASVVKLLQSRDTNRFAAELSPAIADWQSILSTTAARQNPDPLAGFRQSEKREHEQMEQSAQQFLAAADSLRLDFSKGNLRAKVIPPRNLGSTHYPGIMAENETLPYVEKLELIVTPDSGAANATGGEFKLCARGLLKFPGGWRSLIGVDWLSFPPNVADAKTMSKMALLEKAADFKGITEKDDPALLKLGDALVHFIRDRDAEIFRKEAFPSTELMWAMFQERGVANVSRKDLDDHLNDEGRTQTATARATLQQMEDAGIDLKNAGIQIEEVTVKRIQPQGRMGSLSGLMGSQFQLKLAVKADGKSKTGASLSGEYILAANQIMRFPEDWKVMDNVHWYQLPAGLVDDKANAKMEYENYIAEHGTLPLGSAAPEIEFTTLDGGKKMSLSDLRGKVVVLDFWATWCGPCQEPMARLQTLRQTHPDWKDKVAIVPLSIDDTIKIVRDHVTKRGWTNTFNVWAEDGGWRSRPAMAFRVRGVPTTYIIDAQGRITKAGHPAGMDIGEEVDGLVGK